MARPRTPEERFQRLVGDLVRKITRERQKEPVSTQELRTRHFAWTLPYKGGLRRITLSADMEARELRITGAIRHPRASEFVDASDQQPHVNGTTDNERYRNGIAKFKKTFELCTSKLRASSSREDI